MNELSPVQEQIADLYYKSGSVHLEPHRWSYHLDNPNLPNAPWYLHYPQTGEPGSEYLPKLYRAVGWAFYDLNESQEPPIRPIRIAATPKGAVPLGEALANCYVDSQSKLIKIDKVVLPDETSDFNVLDSGHAETTEIVDDHVSKSRNKQLMVSRVRARGFVVRHALSVVDHEMGARAALAAMGVSLHSLLTGRQMLEYGHQQGDVKRTKYDEIAEFQALNFVA